MSKSYWSVNIDSWTQGRIKRGTSRGRVESECASVVAAHEELMLSSLQGLEESGELCLEVRSLMLRTFGGGINLRVKNNVISTSSQRFYNSIRSFIMAGCAHGTGSSLANNLGICALVWVNDAVLSSNRHRHQARVISKAEPING